jgi:hypothetical protein
MKGYELRDSVPIRMNDITSLDDEYEVYEGMIVLPKMVFLYCSNE